MKLYELREELHFLEKMLEDEEAVDPDSFKKAIAAVDMEMSAKVANIGLMIKQLKADITARDEAIDSLKAGNVTSANRIEWLKEYLLGNMRSNVKTPLISISKQQGREIAVLEEGYEPPAYLVPQPDKLDKAALLKDLKAGVVVPGAELGRGPDFIVIR